MLTLHGKAWVGIKLRTFLQWGYSPTSGVREKTSRRRKDCTTGRTHQQLHVIHYFNKLWISDHWPFFSTHLESESLVEDGVESFLVNLGVKLLLLVGEHKDLDVGVGCATAVHGEEVGRLQDPNGKLRMKNADNVQSTVSPHCQSNAPKCFFTLLDTVSLLVNYHQEENLEGKKTWKKHRAS